MATYYKQKYFFGQYWNNGRSLLEPVTLQQPQGSFSEPRSVFPHYFDQIFIWPICSKFYKIRNPLSVARPGKVFILGGCCDEKDTWKTVQIFENDGWRFFGELETGRINFMTITYGTDVMIIGGTTQNKAS